MPALISRRGQKRWRAGIKVDGKPYQKLFPDDSKKSQREAVRWEEDKKMELATPVSRTDIVSLSIVEWAQEYLDYTQARHCTKTYQEKQAAFRRLLEMFGPEKFLCTITNKDALRFLSEQAKTRSGYASNKDRKNLVAAWTWGTKYLDGFPDTRNPFQVVEKFPEVKRPRYIPPEEDLWKVMDVIDDVQDRTMLLTYIYTAARRSEVFKLMWSDIDFGQGTIRLWTKKRQGGHQEANILPMSSELQEALSYWRDHRPIKDHTHVFLCLDKYSLHGDYYGQPFKERRHFMNTLCKKAKVKPFGFHAIRHLTASVLFHQGQSVSVIQSLLRHQNPTTTNRYLHSLGSEHTRAALEGLGKSKVIHLDQHRKVVNE